MIRHTRFDCDWSSDVCSSDLDDDFGWLNIDRLRRDGVDTSAIAVCKGAVTGSAFVTYRDSGERDFIFNITNSASAQLQPEQVNQAVLKDCAHFHVMGSSLFSFRIIDAMKKAIEIVKAQGGTVSFDPNVRKEMLRIPEMREARSEEHTSELQSQSNLVCRLLLEKKKT